MQREVLRLNILNLLNRITTGEILITKLHHLMVLLLILVWISKHKKRGSQIILWHNVADWKLRLNSASITCCKLELLVWWRRKNWWDNNLIEIWICWIMRYRTLLELGRAYNLWLSQLKINFRVGMIIKIRNFVLLKI